MDVCPGHIRFRNTTQEGNSASKYRRAIKSAVEKNIRETIANCLFDAMEKDLPV